MWIRCPNGLDTLVHHEDHIKRLLSEGGVEIADPTLPSVEATIEVSEATQDDTEPANELAITDDGPVVRKRGKRSKE